MVSSSKIENLASRYAPYLDELRDFFRSRGIAYGSPADLQGFPEQLTDPAFHDEMLSMTRSIVYREGEMLPRTELMELIALAVGGPAIDDPEQDLHLALRRLLALVSDATRPVRSEASSVDGETPQSPSGLTAGQILQSRTASALPLPLDDQDHDTKSHINDRLSRALVSSGAQSAADDLEYERIEDGNSVTEAQADLPPGIPADLDSGSNAEDNWTTPSFLVAVPSENGSVRTAESPAAEPEQALTPDPAEDRIAGEPVADLTDKQPVRPAFKGSTPAVRSTQTFFRRSYWIPGVFALFLAAVAIWFLQQKSKTPSTPTRKPVATRALPPSTGLGKPSAYGAPIHQASRRGESIPQNSLQPAAEAPVDAPPDTTPRDTPAPVPERRTGSTRLSSSARTVPLFSGREGVFLASSGIMASHLVSAPAPGYPKLARLTRIEGSVIVQVVVDRNGKVEATRVLDGPHLLRGAAEHAIRRWRYRPFLVDGKPTDVATIVTVSFRLHE